MNHDFGPFHTPVSTSAYRGLPWWGLVTDPSDDPGPDWLQPDELRRPLPGPRITTSRGPAAEARSAT